MEGPTLYCGMDVSKGRADVAVLHGEGKRLKHRQFADTPEERTLLCLWLQGHLKEQGAAQLVIGMEPTGGYEVHFFRALKANEWQGAQVEVRQVNTTAVRGHHQTTGQRTQNDPSSAWTIAEIVQKHPNMKKPVLDSKQRSLRGWVRSTEKDIEDIQSLKTELGQLVYEQMPFVLPYLEHGPRWVLKLLMEQPSAHKLAALHELPDIAKAPKDKLQDILRQARRQAEELPENPISELLIKEKAEAVLLAERKVDRQQKAIVEHIEKDKDKDIEKDKERLKHLLTIPSLGKYTAIVVYTELFLGGREYATPEKLEKAAGMDIVERQSGDLLTVMRLSKRGPSAVRRLLFLAACRVVKRPGVFQDYYNKMLKRRGNRPKLWALVAVMKKLLRVIWKLWTTKQDFEADHEARWKASHPVVESHTKRVDPAVESLCQLSPEQLKEVPLSRLMRRKVRESLQRRKAESQEAAAQRQQRATTHSKRRTEKPRAAKRRCL